MDFQYHMILFVMMISDLRPQYNLTPLIAAFSISIIPQSQRFNMNTKIGCLILSLCVKST